MSVLTKIADAASRSQARYVVPRAVRGFVAVKVRQKKFADALAEFRALPVAAAVSTAVLDRLVENWGNSGFSAQYQLAAGIVAQARLADGPILECGSGLSTLLLGVEAERRGLTLHSLEHMAGWAARVQREIDLAGIKSATLVQAPITSHGEFDWYDVDVSRLPAKKFKLVICDGPPAETRGGRYGLLPVMRERLDTGCIILLDDFSRADEKAVAQRWCRESGATLKVCGDDRPYAEIRLP